MSERDRLSDVPVPGAPRAVAGYRLLRKIGEGGMSAVFQSYDVTVDRPVAVKLLAEHLAGQPEFVGRFYREARLSRVLEHANVVQGYASGFDADVTIIDPELEWTVDASKFKSKSRNTPWDGVTLKGKAVAVIAKGILYELR